MQFSGGFFLFDFLTLASILPSMKKLIFLLLISLTCYGQNEYMNVLDVYTNEIGVTPSGKIWITESSGQTHHTDRFDQPWNLGPFDTINDGGGVFERVTCFLEDVLMISGLINEYPSNDGIVYRSEDGGKTFKKVFYGGNDWLDAVYANENGKAWMSGSSRYIFYTEDTGKTWSRFPGVISNEDFRVNSIYFLADGKTGLFASHSGYIARTKDNCATWELLPSPLSQSKLHNPDKQRPDINKLRAFGNNYIVQQLDQIFISKAETIAWIPMPNIKNFEVTADNRVYLVGKDGIVELMDDQQNIIWTSKERIHGYPKALFVRDNILYAYAFYSMYSISTSHFEHNIMLAAGSIIETPTLQLNHKKEKLGFEGNMVLKYNDEIGKWYRYTELPFEIKSVGIINDTIIITTNLSFEHYSFNTVDRSLKPFILPRSLYADRDIKKITFEKGSSGCFNHSVIFREYDHKNGSFRKGLERFGKSNAFDNMKKNIDEGIVRDIIKEIEEQNDSISFEDLEITQKDISDFKKFITKKEKDDNLEALSDYSDPYHFPDTKIDFNFYKNSADSLRDISPEILNNVFNAGSNIMSTQVSWNKLIIEFNDGFTISIANDDYLPNYLNTPWIVNYNGILFKSPSIKLGKLIEKLSNGCLFEKTQLDRKYAIFKIVDHLYRSNQQ